MKDSIKKKQKITKSLMCDYCYSKNIYTLQDKTIVCRKCGYRKIQKRKKK